MIKPNPRDFQKQASQGYKLAHWICAEHCIVLSQIQKSHAHIGIRRQIIYELRWLGLGYGTIAHIIKKDRHSVRYWASDAHRKRSLRMSNDIHRRRRLTNASDFDRMEKFLYLEWV